MKRNNGNISFLLLLMGTALITLGISVATLTGEDYTLAARYRNGIASQCLAESGLMVAVKLLEGPAGIGLPESFEYQSPRYNENGTAGHFTLRIISARGSETMSGTIYSMGITENGTIKRSVVASYSRPTIVPEGSKVSCSVLNVKSL